MINLFKKKSVVEQSLPVPDYLRLFTSFYKEKKDSSNLRLESLCICGSKSFAINFFGEIINNENNSIILTKDFEGQQIIIVKATCNHCKRKFNLFDSRLNGYDRFFNNNNLKILRSPETINWSCGKCNYNNFCSIIEIETADLDEFIEENKEVIHSSHYVNAFHWIIISPKCNRCNHENKNFVDYECA